MAVKYTCTKCSKRFVDWGVKKIKAGEACSDCTGEFLELVVFDSSKPAPKKKPTLKRKRGAAAAVTAVKTGVVEAGKGENSTNEVRVLDETAVDSDESPVPDTTPQKG